MDIRSTAAVVSATVSVCGFLGGIVLFCIIKFNDMRHIELNLKEIKTDVKDIKKTLDIHGQEISHIKGTMCVKSTSRRK
jgi:hypothetical protein